MLQEEIFETGGHGGLDHALDLGGDQFVLGLGGELGIGQLHRQNGREALAGVIAGGGDFLFLRRQLLFDVVVERAGERRAVAREMGAAVLLRNVVGVAEHAFLIGIVPLHRHFDLGVAIAVLEPQHGGVHRRLAAIQVGDEGLETTLVLEYFALLVALVHQFNAHPGIQEGQLAQTLGQGVVIERDIRENLRAGLEAQRRAPLRRIAHCHQRGLGHSQPIFLAVQLALAANVELEEIRQRIDHRHADPVQTAGDLVRGVIELPAGMQHGHDDLGGGDSLLGVEVYRNASAVVRDGHRLVGMDGDHNPIAVTRQRLIDGVIHHLENHVVQAAAVVGIADVHSRPLSNGIKPL